MPDFQFPPSQTPPLERVGDEMLFREAWSRWFVDLANLLSSGYTGTVSLAKLTGGGTDGALTFTYGILTGVVAPT